MIIISILQSYEISWFCKLKSRTHRKASERNECLRVTKPTKSMICGLCFFFLVPFQRQTNAPFRQSCVTKSLQKNRASGIVTIFHVSRWFVVRCHYKPQITLWCKSKSICVELRFVSTNRNVIILLVFAPRLNLKITSAFSCVHQ